MWLPEEGLLFHAVFRASLADLDREGLALEQCVGTRLGCCSICLQHLQVGCEQSSCAVRMCMVQNSLQAQHCSRGGLLAYDGVESPMCLWDLPCRICPLLAPISFSSIYAALKLPQCLSEQANCAFPSF